MDVWQLAARTQLYDLVTARSPPRRLSCFINSSVQGRGLRTDHRGSVGRRRRSSWPSGIRRAAEVVLETSSALLAGGGGIGHGRHPQLLRVGSSAPPLATSSRPSPTTYPPLKNLPPPPSWTPTLHPLPQYTPLVTETHRCRRR